MTHGVLLYIQSNIVSVIILLLLYFNRSPSGIKAADQRIFDKLILLTVATLFTDSGMWLLNGTHFRFSLELNYIVSVACYMLTPIVGLMSIVYINYKINGDNIRKSRKRLWMFYLIVIGCGALLVINYFPGHEIIFSISKDNQYKRGDYFWLFNLIPYLFMLHGSGVALGMARKEKNITTRREYIYISTFIIPPLIGGTLQAFTGLSFTWTSVTVSLLFLFIKFQNQHVALDRLTGINNRRQLENYLSWELSEKTNGKLFAYMIDIDNFKSINDRFGHVVGDAALVNAARIIERSIRKNDFAARYGGDEFVIICHGECDSCMELIERLNTAVVIFNKESNEPYELSFSIGYTQYDYAAGETQDDFISHADRNMYITKTSKQQDAVSR